MLQSCDPSSPSYPHSQFLKGIKEAACWAVKTVINKANEVGFDLGGRNGGYFCFLEHEYDDPTIPLTLTTLIGTVPDGEDAEHSALSWEKVRRLHAKYKYGDHRLSWQSRNESKKRYGGAVCASFPTEAFFFGFSGLPELVDEAAMLLAAVKAEYMTLGEAMELAQISENFFFLKNDWNLAA